MPIVVMPDGTRVRFADDMPREQIKSMIASKFPELQTTQPVVKPQQEQSSEWSKTMQARGADLADVVGRYKAGEQTLPETIFQGATKATLGTVGDVAGEAITPVLSGVAKGIQKYTPEPIKEGVKAIGNIPAVEQVGRGFANMAKDASQAFSELSPRAQANIESVGLAAPFASSAVRGVGKGIVNTIKGVPETKIAKAIDDAAVKYGAKLEASADTQIAQQKYDKALDAILPKETTKVRVENAKRMASKGGKGKVFEYHYTPIDYYNISKTVAPLIEKNDNLRAILEKVQKEVSKEGEFLQSSLRKENVALSIDEINGALSDAFEQVKKMPSMKTRDASSVAKAMIAQAKEIYSQYPSTTEGLLQARKKFDNLFKSEYNKLPYDSEGAFGAVGAANLIRSNLNKLIASKTPNVDVQNSLKKQAMLYQAIDNIAPKAEKVGETRLKRFAQKTKIAEKTKAELIGLGALGTGTTYLAAASGFAPIAAGAIGLYGVGKLAKNIATSPTLKKYAGKALKSLKRKGDLSELPIKEQEIIAKELKLLPSPQSIPPIKGDIQVDKKGVASFMGEASQQQANIARSEAKKLGLTPDVLKNNARLEKERLMQKYGQSDLGKVLASNPNATLAEIADLVPPVDVNDVKKAQEIEKMWQSAQISDKTKVAQLLNSVPQVERKKIMGDVIKILDNNSNTAMAQALKKATKKRLKVTITPSEKEIKKQQSYRQKISKKDMLKNINYSKLLGE